MFILGAGASAEAHAPMMSDFLDRADELRKRGAGSEFELVFRAIAALQAVHSKAQLNLDNLESVFGAFEMAQLAGRLPGLSGEELENLIKAFRAVIVQTLESSIQMQYSSDRVTGSPSHLALAKLIGKLDRRRPKRRSSVITFNYDLLLDYAFHFTGYDPRYFVNDESGRQGPALLKLHGSLNWTRCSKCRGVVPWRLNDYFAGRHFNLIDQSEPEGTIRFAISSHLASSGLTHCESDVDGEAAIVPPTWSKGPYHSSLARVWRQAALELSEAENIFVCGYSLTETDSFFRYLFALGSVGSTRIKRFWVLDPDGRGIVEQRFRALLGPGAENRFRLVRTTFAKLPGLVANELVDDQT